jgi:hypothetical protein
MSVPSQRGFWQFDGFEPPKSSVVAQHSIAPNAFWFLRLPFVFLVPLWLINQRFRFRPTRDRTTVGLA